jgi:hypothetical protein
MSQGQRNVLLGIISVAAISVAAYMFTSQRAGSQPGSTQATTHGVCLACEQESVVQHALGEYAPFACSQCDELAVYPWFYCYECQKRFVPALHRPKPGEPLRLPMSARCPSCGGGDVGLYDPMLPTQETVVGDVKPLPNWVP